MVFVTKYLFFSSAAQMLKWLHSPTLGLVNMQSRKGDDDMSEPELTADF